MAAGPDLIIRWRIGQCGWLLCLSLLAGCNLSPTGVLPPVEESRSWRPVMVQPKPPELSIHQLLYRAETALARDRLMLPAGDNAYGWYQQVLKREPQHQEAKQGLLQIARRYLQLAGQALQSGESSRAELLLQRAAQAGASKSQITALRQRQQPLALAANEFALNQRDLSARNERLLGRLGGIAERARQANSRLLIIARSDDEARWIYQQMRQAVPGYRLRGNIQLGRLPRVVLLDLND